MVNKFNGICMYEMVYACMKRYMHAWNGICMYEKRCLLRDGVLEKDKEKNYSAIKEQSETSASGPWKTLE